MRLLEDFFLNLKPEKVKAPTGRQEAADCVSRQETRASLILSSCPRPSCSAGPHQVVAAERKSRARTLTTPIGSECSNVPHFGGVDPLSPLRHPGHLATLTLQNVTCEDKKWMGEGEEGDEGG